MRQHLPLTALCATLAVALIGVFSCKARPPETQTVPPEARFFLDWAAKSKTGQKDFFTLCDRFGPRLTGTGTCVGAARWLEERLREAGLSRVRSETFPVMNPWECVTEAATCKEPVAFPLRIAALPGSPPFLKGKELFSGELLTGPATNPRESLALLPTEPAPAAVQADKSTFLAAETEALARGFGGLLIQSPLEGRTLFRANLHPLGAPLGLPTAFVAREDFSRLIRLAADGPVRLSLEIETRTRGWEPGVNVIAELPGREKPEEIVLLGTHYDSWDLAVGAHDNAINVALLLEAARAIAALGTKPRRTLRFVFFSGEEQDRQGSLSYTTQHETELEKHLITLFCDLGSEPIKGFLFNEQRDIGKLFNEAFLPVPQFRSWWWLNQVEAGTDNLDFLLEGVPSAVATADTRGYDRAHHSNHDLPATVNLQALSRNTALVATVAFHLANRDRIEGYRQPPAVTERIIERTGIAKEIEGTVRWERFQNRKKKAGLQGLYRK